MFIKIVREQSVEDEAGVLQTHTTDQYYECKSVMVRASEDGLIFEMDEKWEPEGFSFNIEVQHGDKAYSEMTWIYLMNNEGKTFDRYVLGPVNRPVKPGYPEDPIQVEVVN